MATEALLSADPDLLSPTTPPGVPPRQPSNSPSDDSLLELSFDYVMDEAGNIKRISKRGSHAGSSPHSSPPTPLDTPPPLYSTASKALLVEDNRASSSERQLSPMPRRVSLSRSESAYPALSSSTSSAEREQRASISPINDGAPSFPRTLQRTASTPAAVLPSSSLRTSHPQSVGSTRRPLPRPQRVSGEDAESMEEKENRMYGRSYGSTGGLNVIASKSASRLLKSTTASDFAPSAGVDVVPEAGDQETDAEYDGPPPNSAPAAGLSKSRSYVSRSGLSTSSRPRRSASLSDAAQEQHPERRSPPHQRGVPSSIAALKTSGSLGPPGTAGRARRVTFEEKVKMERERNEAIEREERARKEAELLAKKHAEEEAARLHEACLHENKRKSPSPTHISAAAHLRPAYGHQRRDSDTLRSIAPLPGRRSPSALANEGNTNPFAPVSSSARHRRSPTAPEFGASAREVPNGQLGRTWAAGDDRGTERDSDVEREREREHKRETRERGAVVAKREQLTQSMPAPPPPQAQPLQLPAGQKNITVNRKPYARLDVLGKGGSSRVYRVMSPGNEVYAIKRVSLERVDEETLSGYMNEIQLLKRLAGNSRIIRLFDSELKNGSGGAKGVLLLVMECGEIDLARLLQEQQKEPMNMVWVSYYWQQMLQAVQIIHDVKIVHSDLKPANFVLVRGQLKLIDFGIANAIGNDTTNIQRDHQIGTVNYMSPEAIELPEGMRRLKVGRASDVWSLGCILYQMIYGHPPFQHLNMHQKMRAIPDPNHAIAFPREATRGPIDNPTPGTGRRVRADVIAGIKSCLVRHPKERATIPELLEQDWLAMNEPERPSAQAIPQDRMSVKELHSHLQDTETIINPHYMSQLLQYGMSLAGNPSMNNEEALHHESLRLVTDLREIYKTEDNEAT